MKFTNRSFEIIFARIGIGREHCFKGNILAKEKVPQQSELPECSTQLQTIHYCMRIQTEDKPLIDRDSWRFVLCP
jgi:hypothetical protein